MGKDIIEKIFTDKSKRERWIREHTLKGYRLSSMSYSKEDRQQWWEVMMVKNVR